MGGGGGGHFFWGSIGCFNVFECISKQIIENLKNPWEIKKSLMFSLK